MTALLSNALTRPMARRRRRVAGRSTRRRSCSPQFTTAAHRPARTPTGTELPLRVDRRCWATKLGCASSTSRARPRELPDDHHLPRVQDVDGTISPGRSSLVPLVLDAARTWLLVAPGTGRADLRPTIVRSRSAPGQAAQALERACLRVRADDRRDVAASVLPLALPRVEGVQLAARYLPDGAAGWGATGSTRSSCPTALGLAGDVVGKGLQAPRAWGSCATRSARSRSSD